ncbi:MAG: GDSL-type esterase/lipase family protein [Bacteroidales bacterium]
MKPIDPSAGKVVKIRYLCHPNHNRTSPTAMQQRNFEPLFILIVSGIFLFFVAGGVLHVFPGKPEGITAPESLPVKSVDKQPLLVVKPDSLRALFADQDTISSLFTGLDEFYHSIQHIQADHTILHIAYFGDSMIEGDLVTQSLRRAVQKRFGGSGIGFIPVTSPLPGFRTTIRQSFNNSWSVCSFVHPCRTDGISPGISGFAFVSEEGAETKFESAKGFGPFHQAEILFGGKNRIVADIRTDTSFRTLSLAPEKPVSSVKIATDSAYSVLEINVRSTEPGVFYGVNFENGPGVYVDNYAFRGNSGLPLSAIPPEIYSGFNATLKNKLLVLHYGLNVFTPGVEDYHWYETAMVNVVRHVRQSSPGVSILLISMPDRSALIMGEYHTPAGLPEFIQLQKRVAEKEHIAFFNLYEAMGGANSMKKWVEGEPKMGGDDYTHPNGAGAAKIASLVYDFLMKGYDLYLQKPDSAVVNKPGIPLL